MGIQKCKNCGTKFKYKALLQPFWGFADPLQCSNCGTIHHVTWISRFTISILIMLPLFFNNAIRSLSTNILLLLLVYFVYLFILRALLPFIVRYGLKDTNIIKG